MLKFYNTLGRKKQIFKPIKKNKVKLYTCGPTVYLYAHIGNLRTYIFEDILKRVLEYNRYKVKHIMNITDVGHLVSDADTGEDKLEKGAKRENKSVWALAKFYTQAFKNDLDYLNILSPDVWLKATDTIKEQIALIRLLEKKGFTYQIEDGIYFDTLKLKNYGKLRGVKKIEIQPGARVEVVKGKKNTTDFALWKLTPKGVKRQMEWNSPWGKGFPGWHTECVVMSIKKLGIPFDIHCGGIDHIPIHHTNEIAQAEAGYGKDLANYWLHGEFLIGKEKMSKSKSNFIILDDLNKKGICPLAYRYLCLTAHYRSKLNFSWESLKAAENALQNLYQKIRELQNNEDHPRCKTKKRLGLFSSGRATLNAKFLGFINDDLDMPKAIALMWKMLDDKKLSDKDKYELLLDFDKVFGLGLKNIKKQKISKKLLNLVKQRQKYREEKNWAKADEIRKQIEKQGYSVEDTDNGSKIIAS